VAIVAENRAALAGIRSDDRVRPVARGLRRLGHLPRWTLVAAAAVVVLVATPAAGVGIAIHTMSSQAHAIDALRADVRGLQAKVDAQPDWGVIAAKVEPSVFIIETDYGLGSGWVARSGQSGSELVTNFHVIADAWNAGVVTVSVRQGDRTVKGIITRVDPSDDLAVIHVAGLLPTLQTAPFRPTLAQAVMVVGAPLGLGGSLSVGVISGFRSLEGSDYVQFSAPISPGNSGGPVVDTHGRVVAVASAKFEGQGVEALSLAIPVQIACNMVVACSVGSDQ